MSTTIDLDWNVVVSQLLDHPSQVPEDITYRVLDKEGKSQGELKAHKLILAAASNVFRNGFFGSENTDKKANILYIKDTSFKAFSIFIDSIYKKPVHYDLLSIEEIFDVVYLATRYEIQALKELLNHRLENVKVDKVNILEVFKIAEDFKVFEESSKILKANCAQVLRDQLENIEDVINFLAVAEDAGNGDEAKRLTILMKSVKPSACTNCKSRPCKNGKYVENIDQLRAGMKIKPNTNVNFSASNGMGYSGGNFGLTKVVSVQKNNNQINVEPGEGSYKFSQTQPFNKNYFMFSCS